MKDLIIVILFLALLVMLFVYLSAKPEKKKILLLNSQNKSVEVTVEIAKDPITKMKGLMFRKSLDDKEGMLFIFDRNGIYPFWMMNVTIPLEAVLINEDLRVVEVMHMYPCTSIANYCKTYTPKSTARYVLEVNEGFSEKYDINTGSKVDLRKLK